MKHALQATQNLLLEVQLDNSSIVPFSIQSISLRDSASSGISFFIFISVISRVDLDETHLVKTSENSVEKCRKKTAALNKFYLKQERTYH